MHLGGMLSLSRNLLIVASALTLPAASRAAITITWTDTGSSIQAVATGSFTSAELAEADFNFDQSLGAGASYDTTPRFYNFTSAGTFNRYYINTSKVTAPAFTNFNDYSGQASGDSFGILIFGGYLSIILPKSYVAGSSIAATAIFTDYGMPLSSMFSFGDVVKVNGNTLITYVNGSAQAPVPEPSTYGLALGSLALAAVAIRRRAKRA